MNRDDIIRMAKESGLPRWYQTDEVVNMDLLGRFAALVAAAEREACAVTCYDLMCKENPYERWEGMKWCMDAIRARRQ